MTEEDVIRAMEICIDDDGRCSRCPFEGIDGCIGKMEKIALRLLIHYRADNERLMGQIKAEPSECEIKHSECATNNTDLISVLKESQKSYSEKKRKHKKYIPLSQYWSGREAEAKRIIEILKRKDDGK